jgi:O-succinylhomoserine sulfhydrylase
MGALTLLCLSVLQAGDHIVCSRSVFGSIIKLLGSEMARFGVETSFVSQTDLGEWKAAIRPGKTKMLLAETPTNPLTEVCDIAALADLAHNADALLVVDNCFCTPALQKPLALGADVIMQSATKYLDGQGRVIAGALCASNELIHQKILPVQRSMGITLSPFNAWVVLKGLETLNLRMKAHSEQALTLATWLENHPGVERVYYPGLASHPQHALAMRQQNAMGSGLGGAVLSFAVKGKTPDELRANAFAVIDGTRILSISANLGDVKTIITHPASTTHGRLSEDQRLAAGIHQGVLRVAVGLEAMSDIQRDLATGLNSLS